MIFPGFIFGALACAIVVVAEAEVYDYVSFEI